MTAKARLHLGKDPALKELIARVGPVSIRPHRREPFDALVQAIVYQQLSGKAAATIFERFLALWDNDGARPSAAQILATRADRLRSCGLSRAKADFIRGLARAATEGALPTLAQCKKMADEEIVEGVTAHKGVGRWTAQMLLIFNLGRPDVLPVLDLGVRTGFRLVYSKRQLPKPDALARYGERWAPYRSYASLYLWRAADLAKIKR